MLCLDLFEAHDMVLTGSFVFIPQNHCVPNLVASSILAGDHLDNVADPSIADNLGDLFEIRMIFADAMISKVLCFCDSITDS